MQHPGEAAMPAAPHVGIAVADLGERILDTLQRRDLVVGVELLRCGRRSRLSRGDGWTVVSAIAGRLARWTSPTRCAAEARSS